MLVNISKACQLAGISRTVFYQNYINKGKITVSRDGRNRPMVDTSEIVRVFGELKTVQKLQYSDEQNIAEDNSKKEQIVASREVFIELVQLKAENLQMKERLREKDEQLIQAESRQQWQQEQIGKLTDTIKLLEAPKSNTPSSNSRNWWQFWK
jgi:hypothetical protein